MTNWPTKKLGEVINPQYGYTTSAKDKGNFRFVRITDINEGGELKSTEKKYVSASLKEIKNYILTKGDLLVARTGSIGRMLYFDSDEPAIFASYLIRLKLDISQISPKYLWLFSHTPSYWGQVGLSASGAVQPQFNANRIKMIKIPLPPLKTQQQIIDRLDAIKKAQELNDKQIALADELFQSLLEKELEPKGKNWEVRKLGEICEKIQQTHPQKIFKDKFKYIDIESVEPKTNTIIDIKVIEVNKAPSRARKLVKEGDTIFATTRPYLKHIAYITKEFDNCISSTGFCVIRGKRNFVEQKFLFFISLSKLFISKVLIYQRGASYPAVPDSNIYNLRIHLPSLETQRQIVEKLQAVQDYKKKLLEQKQKLRELFASCLDKAMKGELAS